MESAKILVVDDETSILKLLKEALTQWGYQVACVSTGTEALEAIRTELFDAAITDIRMPEMTGLDLLREIKRHDESIEVVVMTGYPTIASAVEALKEGAYDYLSKPLILDELRHLMARVTERRFLKGEVQSLRARLGEELSVNELVGNASPMQRVKEIIGKVATTDSPVLIEGESGTGKELVAAAIHRLSTRAKGPFIPVNCSAIPEDLLESEFFGHVRGAFSGAVSDALGLFRGANDGTIFLDEIAELSPGLQVKLLRVLQEMQVRPVGSTKAHSVDVRVIAATNRDLDRSIADGRFRQDLYYRLNVVRVSLPPLRARRDDIPALVNHFLRRYNRRFRRDVKGITPDALAALAAYEFPGNVRELENVIERAFAMGAREQITFADLPTLGNAIAIPATSATATGTVPRLADVEKDLILRALAFYKDDKEAAASALGISRRTIYRRLKEYGML
ncbi:MAG: two-component system response regulator [Candidatus Rokuibacteriota bacterium]|nr:MAG: two-component system response regulator [Candidatus Rokubacteria bacterium]